MPPDYENDWWPELWKQTQKQVKGEALKLKVKLKDQSLIRVVDAWAQQSAQLSAKREATSEEHFVHFDAQPQGCTRTEGFFSPQCAHSGDN